ncbi:Lysosomal Pro-X carboxypeptidase, partial [Cucurbita argyrosperma subsp. sororia]
MDSILSQSIVLPLLLLLVSSYASAHIPRLGLQRRASRNKPQQASTLDGLATFYYKQPLDHFNYQPQSYDTFDQRYVIDFKHWQGVNLNAPIIVGFGSEGDVEDDISFLDFPIRLASRYKAMLVYLEHRFYGKSVPFGSIEKAMKNASVRGYLNSAQALADYAEMLLHIKKMFASQTSPTIVIGASYGGMLASWFRLKYPHIALGALASSAPILYFDNITPQDGYYSIVSKSFKETSQTCYETIRRSWAEVDRIANNKPEGLMILSKRFKTCEKLNGSDELKYYLDYVLTSAAQYNNPHEKPVRGICAAIDEAARKNSDVIEQVVAGVVAFMGERDCYDVFESGHPNNPIDPFTWQEYSEIVMPIGVSGKDKDSMFPTAPFDFNKFKKDCKALYGVSPNPHWITTLYGGQDLKLILHRFGSNIIFSNGLKDPYSSGGVLHNISESIVAIPTAEGSHCLDLQEGMEDDPEWLISQRKAEMDIIDAWISKYYADLLQSNQTLGAH